MWLHLRSKCRRTGHQFTITPEDIIIPAICPILGIPLEYKDGKGAWSNAPSVDRFDNNIGYIPGNVWVISTKANRMKSDANKQELLKFAFWIYKTYLNKT